MEGQGDAGARLRSLSHQGPLGFWLFGKGVPHEVSKAQDQTENLAHSQDSKLVSRQGLRFGGGQADQSGSQPVSVLSI